MSLWSKCKLCSRALRSGSPSEYRKEYKLHYTLEHQEEWARKLGRRRKREEAAARSSSGRSDTNSSRTTDQRDRRHHRRRTPTPTSSSESESEQTAPVPVPVPVPARRAYCRIRTFTSSESEHSDSESAPPPRAPEPEPVLPAPVPAPEIRIVDDVTDSVRVRSKSQSSSGYESLLPNDEDEVEGRRDDESCLPARINQRRRRRESEIEVIQIDSSEPEDENTPPGSASTEAVVPRTEEPASTSIIFCIICEEEFQDQETCARHELTAHIRPCQCDRCPADFPYPSELGQHVADAHPPELPAPAQPAPVASPLQEVVPVPSTQKFRKTYPYYITRVSWDNHNCFECTLCGRGKIFKKLSRHMRTKKHQNNVAQLSTTQAQAPATAPQRPESPTTITIIDRNQTTTQAQVPAVAPQRPDSPTTITIIDRNQTTSTAPVQTAQFAQSQLQPSTSSSGYTTNSTPGAPESRIPTIREPLKINTRRQEEELSSLLSPVTSSGLSQKEDEVHASGTLKPFFADTFLTEACLEGTNSLIRFIRHKNSKEQMGFKCLRKGCGGQEFRNELAARNHHQTAHKNQIKNLKCKICHSTFKTKEEWKMDQLAHQNPTGLLVEIGENRSAPLNVVIPAADESPNPPTTILSPPASGTSVPDFHSPMAATSVSAVITTVKNQIIRIPFGERSDSINQVAQSITSEGKPSTSGTSKRSHGNDGRNANGASPPKKRRSELNPLLVSIPLTNFNPHYRTALQNGVERNASQLPSSIIKTLKK